MEGTKPQSGPDSRYRRFFNGALIAVVWLTAGGWLLKDRLQPRFVLVDSRLDLGRVNAGASAEARFRVENRGLAPLRIHQVVGSCGCLTPEYPESIPPFGNAEIRTRFEPLPQWNGPMDKVLTIRTSDPAHREVQAHLLANVQGLVRREPPDLPPVAYRYGETRREQIRLTPRPGSGVRLTGATSDAAFIRPRLIPPVAGKPDGASTLEVTVGPCNMVGDFSLPVRVTTTDPQIPHMDVMVMGMAASGPVLNPIRIFMSTVRPGNPGDEIVQARVFTREGKLRVLDARTTLPTLKVRIVEDEPGRTFLLNLFQTETLKSGPHEGRLIVETDAPGPGKTLSVPIHLTVK